jgi:hypothetical protein
MVFTIPGHLSLDHHTILQLCAEEFAWRFSARGVVKTEQWRLNHVNQYIDYYRSNCPKSSRLMNRWHPHRTLD